MDALLNLSQAAKTLSLSKVYLRKLVRSGKLPAVRIGRRLLFEPAQLELFIESHRTKAARPGLLAAAIKWRMESRNS